MDREEVRSGSTKVSVWIAVAVVSVASLVASAYSPKPLDAFGISLLTVSACLITPHLVAGAFESLTPPAGAEASDDVLKLGLSPARWLARFIWASSRGWVVYVVAGTSAVLLGLAIRNAHVHPESHTAKTLWLAGFGYGLGLTSIALGVVGVALKGRTKRAGALLLREWLRSARPAVLLGSLAFLAATAIQLIVTYRV